MFECLKCAACCRGLITNYASWRLGLFLLPDEIHLFPEPMVVPMWGIGLKGKRRPRPKVIGTLQLNQNVCPHIDDSNLCKIYEKRPSVCRAHPLSVIIDENKILSASIDAKCPYAQKIPSDHKVRLSDYFGNDILKANAECCSYLEAMFQDPRTQEAAWLYDLRSNIWKKIDEKTVLG